ncbi:HotDog domain-containing protein [Dactylonectria macrodidyma]|uniref:HotDog domain-containing protein n=1 Tax=Dactylonectria macrodidyma TaxID=307937 RepID=A0A9P9EQ81_9HYPO|nr:HotDog domain-containing protein [Dactylonectria macrodidyma]
MLEHLKLISATSSQENTRVVFLLKGGPNLTNRIGNLHGGAVALIYDMCTTMCTAPLAKKGFWEFGGVSRCLSVTYMRPAKASMDILVECEVLQLGKRLATIRGQMRDRATGNLLSVAEHNKVSISFAQPNPTL